MELAERAAYYYYDLKNNCAVSILMAAGDRYGLGFTEADALLFKGFGGGMSRGEACGCLTASIGVLSRMFGRREDFRKVCGDFVCRFESGMGLDTIRCEQLTARYKTPERRCTAAVETAAGLLEDYIAGLQ